MMAVNAVSSRDASASGARTVPSSSALAIRCPRTSSRWEFTP